MKLKVLRLFRDKFDPKKSYQPGTEVNFDDEARCNDLFRRGLCEAVNDPSKKTAEKPKKAEAPAEETPEVPAEEPEKAEAPAEENPAEETPAEEKESEAKAPKSGTAKKGSKK